MFLIPRDRVTLRSWLAWYHLAAGFAGVMIVLLTGGHFAESVSQEANPAIQALLLGMLLLFGLVGWAGILIEMRSSWARPAVIVLQALQVPVIAVGPYKWLFFAGGYVVPFWHRAAGLSGAAGLKASIELAWQSPDGMTRLGANLVPFVIIWLLVARLPFSESLQSASAVIIEV